MMRASVFRPSPRMLERGEQGALTADNRRQRGQCGRQNGPGADTNHATVPWRRAGHHVLTQDRGSPS